MWHLLLLFILGFLVIFFFQTFFADYINIYFILSLFGLILFINKPLIRSFKVYLLSFVWGFFLDLFSPFFFGFYIFIFLLLALVAKKIINWFIQKNFFVFLIFLLILGGIFELTRTIILFFLFQEYLSFHYLWIGYNVFWGSILYLIYVFLKKITPTKKRKRRN